jgi:hypothetical protein
VVHDRLADRLALVRVRRCDIGGVTSFIAPTPYRMLSW